MVVLATTVVGGGILKSLISDDDVLVKVLEWLVVAGRAETASVRCKIVGGGRRTAVVQLVPPPLVDKAVCVSNEVSGRGLGLIHCLSVNV